MPLYTHEFYDQELPRYMCIVAQTQGHLHVHYEQFVIHLTFFVCT